MNEITLSPDIQQNLTKLIEREPEPIARRARLILAYGDGLQTFQAAGMAGLSRGRARYWKREFLLKGMSIFKSTPESLDVPPEKEGLDELPVVEEGNETETKIELPELELEFGKKHKHPEKKNKKLIIPELPWPEPVRSPRGWHRRGARTTGRTRPRRLRASA